MKKKIQLLNLSNYKFNYPTLKYASLVFSGGEEHIRISQKDLIEDGRLVICSNMSNSSDIMKLLLGTDVLKSFNKNNQIELFAPYFPYARQDRRMVEGEPFSVKVMANLINSQKYDKVHILDPHSDVTTALIDNINIIDNFNYVKMVWNDIKKRNPINTYCLVSPDAGAEKKTYKLATKLELFSEQLIRGSKKRNVINGSLSHSEFLGDVKDKICVIIDDIIDGGATFVELSKKLKEKGALKVYLTVSHGIFSRGIEPLKPFLDGIYTTNSIKTLNDDFVKTINLNEFFSL